MKRQKGMTATDLLWQVPIAAVVLVVGLMLYQGISKQRSVAKRNEEYAIQKVEREAMWAAQRAEEEKAEKAKREAKIAEIKAKIEADPQKLIDSYNLYVENNWISRWPDFHEEWEVGYAREIIAEKKKAEEEKIRLAQETEAKRIAEIKATFAKGVAEEDANILVVFYPAIQQVKKMLSLAGKEVSVSLNPVTMKSNIDALSTNLIDIADVIEGKQIDSRLVRCLETILEGLKGYNEVYNFVTSDEAKLVNKEVNTAYVKALYDLSMAIVQYDAVSQKLPREEIQKRVVVLLRAFIDATPGKDDPVDITNGATTSERIKGATREQRLAYVIAQRYISIKLKISYSPELFNTEYGIHGHDYNYSGAGDTYNGPGQGPASKVLDYGAYLDYLDFLSKYQDAMVWCIRGNYKQNGRMRPFTIAICYSESADQSRQLKFYGSYWGD